MLSKRVTISLSNTLILMMVLASMLLTASPAVAQPNPEINYQGKLTNSSGVAVADGTYNMRFWLLQNTSQATTSAVWTESLTGSNRVQVTNGLFSVMLGSTSALTSIDFNQTLYLGVEIGGTGGSPSWDGEMLPRKPLGMVPAAFETLKLGGVASSSFLRSDTADSASGLISFTGGLLSTASSTITGLSFGTATGTALVIGSDRVTDFTGAGLINNGGALSVSSSSLNLTLEGLTDVNNMTETFGDLLYWNGSAWADIATSSLNLSSASISGLDISSDTNLAVSATGLTLSGDSVALTAGYTIPLTASTTEWQNALASTHAAVTLAGEDYLSLATQQITANAIDPDNLSASDFGSFTCNGTTCTVDASAISNGMLANSSVSFGGVSVALGSSDATPAFNLADATGLPIATGVSGLGTGVATFLATPSSANLASAVTGDTGSGALVFGTNPTLSGAVLNGTLSFDATAEDNIEALIFDADAQDISGIWEVQDDIAFRFGADADWSFEYDEGVDDQLLLSTTKTNTAAITDPMFEVLVGTTPTADQQVFGIAKGTQAANTALFTVDEDGDVDVAGNITVAGTVDGKDIATYAAMLNEAETITADWVNTANPWADNEVVDTLTVTGGTLGSNTIASGATWTTSGTLTIGDGGDRIDIASNSWDVTNGTITGATWNGTAIGDAYLTKTGDWTGTFDGREGSYYLANSFSTTSANYWETQQTARTADDLTNNSIEDLNDVAAITENYGDLLYWNGSAWADIATSSLNLSSASISGLDISSDTNLAVSATGLTLSGDSVALTAGYTIPLTASTTEWQNALASTHAAVTLAGEDYLSLATQQITANAIDPDNLSASDFGSFTCNGTTCTVDASAISNGMLANSSVSFGGVSVALGSSDATPAFNLADATGLPIATGVSGLGTGVATFLATPSSANLASAVTGDTGSGALVFGTNPTLSGAVLNGTLSFDATAEDNIEALIFDADAQDISGIWEVQDDIAFRFGADADWSFEYDEGVDDQLLLSTTKTNTAAITDPMFEVLVGTTPTADQQVFGIAKGTQAANTALFTVDEDGDVDVAGNITVAGTVDGKDIATYAAMLNEAETITADWVNTANPWADNEVVDTLTVTGGTLGSNTIASGATWTTSGTLTIGDGGDRIDIASNSWDVTNGTITGATWNGTAIGDAYLTKTGDWTGTFDGREGSYYLANSFSTTSANYWETQQTARTADDLTNNSIEDLNDVAAITENYGDLLYWNGTAWADIATSSLNLSSASISGLDISSDTNLAVSATGLTLSGDSVALTAGYTIPLTASTTEWQNALASTHAAVTLAGEDYLSLATQQITANAIDPDNLSASDFGSFTCNGTTCTVDASAISNGMLANSSVSFGGVSVALGSSDATPAFNLADATGLPIATGVSGLGTGVATFLATPSSANLASAVTGDTGSGALVFGTNPTLSGAVLNGTLSFDATAEDNIEALIFDADAQDISGIWEVQDDIAFRFGADADWSFEYDEGVDDQLLLSTTKTNTAAITDPMFEVLVGTTPTADQQVFGIAKGTQAANTALFTVDEDGDVDVAGNITVAGTVDGKDIATYAAMLNEAETITADWVNTANPWADNEVVDTLTVTGGTLGSNTIASGATWTTSGTLTIGDGGDRIDIASNSWDVTNGTITGATWNGTAIGDAYLTKTGDWTGTFDGREGSYYLANSFSTTSANYWETQQTARTADDLTNNSIEDLNDVAAITENYGDLLYWNGTAWADIATSSLNLSSASISGLDISSDTNLAVSATGLTLSGDSVALTAGYTIPLTASTTEWQNALASTHAAVTLAGEDYLSLATQQITANAIDPDNLSASDFGSFTCNGTTCTVDASAISNGMLANSSVSFGGVSVALGSSDATPAFNLADATGLPIATGVSGLGTGVATFLATPSSANLASAVTGDTGSGALVFGTNPTLSGAVLNGTLSFDATAEDNIEALIFDADAQDISGIWEVQDDIAFRFGADADWSFEYDEGVDDQFLLSTTKTNTAAITDPMFEVLVGTTPTADQQVFGIAKGTQAANTALFTVDEDGDVDVAGNITVAGTVDGKDIATYAAMLNEAETITADWVNTANPWADNEVVDTLTVTGGTLGSNTIASGATWTTSGTLTIGDGGDRIDIASNSWDVTNGTITGATWNGTAIGDAYLTKTGDWTGTFDGREGSYYLANSFSTTSANYWETQQTARTADDLTNNSIEDLNDVAAITENYGDLLYWNGTAWADIATSSLNLSSASISGLDISSDTNLAVSATGLTLSGDSVALTAGYTIPLTASTTEWQNALASTHAAVTLAGEDYLSLATQQITANAIDPDNLSASDFGSFTCNGTTCTVDASAISNGMLANSSVSFGGVSVALGSSDATPAFNLADATGLPIATGVSGLGTGVATFLATPSSANLASAVTGDTGSGALVFGTNPTLSGAVLNGTLSFDATAEDNIEALIFDADAQDISGIWEVQDDIAFRFGADADWSFEYDEGVDDQLLLSTTKTNTAAITDPMFEVLVGTTPTADQQVFGIAKGTQAANTALFTVDEDGDVDVAGNITVAGTVDGKDIATYAAMLNEAETITADWVNTANPWADNEVVDTLTVTGGTLGSNTIASGATWTTSGTLTIGDGGDRIDIASNSWDVTNGTITGATWNGTAIGDAYLTKTGDWTGTFDGREGSYYLANSFSTTSANYWETQQTARTADDLTNNSIEDLNDVAAITENYGDLLYWNGTAWADIATSSLNLSSASISGLDISSDTNLAVSATGLTLSGDSVALTAGYTIPLTASTTEWQNALASTHAAVTLAGEDYLSLATQQITANAIDPDNLSASDFGSFTCNGTTCTVDASAISNGMLANSSVSFGGVSVALGSSDATPAFNLADATGLPIATGVSGLGTGVATFLATPSSANLASAVTGDTGSGALVFGTNPTLSGAVLNGTLSFDATAEDNIEALIFDADAQDISGIWEVQDDIAFRFGADADWSFEYDEGVDDQLLLSTTKTNTAAITDPMFEVLVGTTPTADQQVFGIAKGTQAANTALFTVDEDGDVDVAGNITVAGTVDGKDIATYAAMLNEAETITADWVNTANPWADNEVVDTLTVTGGTLGSNTIASGATWTTSGTLTIGDGGDRIDIASNSWDVTNGTITGATWNGTAIGDAYLTKTGDWTGTFDGREGSYYLANSFSTTSANYWETQQTARTADDLTNNSIEDLNDVAAITENYGDLLYWNGSAWADVATSSLGLGNGTFLGLSDTPSSYTASAIPFVSGSALAFDSEFVYDGTNLGIGTDAPGAMLDIFGTSNGLRLSYDGSNYSELSVDSSGVLSINSTGGTGSNLALGSGLAEDLALLLDGNGTDWYAGLDDTDDLFKIGTGNQVGTSTLFQISSATTTFNTALWATTTSASPALTVIQSGTGDVLNLFDGATEVLSVVDGGKVGIGSTTPNAKLSLQNTGFSGAGVVGFDQYFQTTNSVASAVQFGNRFYLDAANTATTTIVGSMFRLKDSTTYGNTVRGLEVQTNRGTNTQGENTALSAFARTFGVRAVTSGDAGGTYEPAAGFFETEGTTQGNAMRGYSDTITTATLLSLFHASSTFTGTGLEMNFGNTTGSFASTSSKFLDFQNAGISVFTVSAFGTTTIGDGTTNNMASLQIGFGGICVDNDGTCTATSTGWVVADGFATGNSDLAEMYFSSTELETGEVVVMSGELSVDRATKDSTLPILGVVSTNPGLTIGSDDNSLTEGEKPYPIALSGRVPVKLSTENGEIKAGDELMLSSLPGVAMKATSTGTVIGIALEDFNDTRYYSDTYLNQFGDSMVDPVYEPIFTEYDPRINDGCYFGGGEEIGEAPCVPLTATTSEGIVAEANKFAEQDSVEEQLEALYEKESETKTLVDGREVRVGQVVMFVEKSQRWLDNAQLAALGVLVSTSSITTIGQDTTETVFDRIVALANRFVDGVLSVFTLKADRVETSELCVDGVCINAADLRRLLDEQVSGEVIENNEQGTESSAEVNSDSNTIVPTSPEETIGEDAAAGTIDSNEEEESLEESEVFVDTESDTETTAIESDTVQTETSTEPAAEDVQDTTDSTVEEPTDSVSL
jgi:hypothetical protein